MWVGGCSVWVGRWVYTYTHRYMYTCVCVQMSEHHDEAMHEDGPVMGDLDADANGLLTWEEYSSRLKNHVKQLIEEGEVEQRERVGKDGQPLSIDEGEWKEEG